MELEAIFPCVFVCVATALLGISLQVITNLILRIID